MLRQSFERTQEEEWAGESVAIFLPAESSLYAQVQYTADCVEAVSECICVCIQAKSPSNVQCAIVWSECGWPEAWGGRGRGRGLRLSHGYKSSLLEQWLELTAVPVTYSSDSHSTDASYASACVCGGGLLGGKKPSGILAMLLNICGRTRYSAT